MIFALEWIGFIFINILGSLSHFIFEWSGHNKVAAVFCAVNESTWEHMKLVIGPTILWALIEVLFIGGNPNFIFAKMMSLVISTAFIPIFFYSYQLILKKDVFYLDILDFILAIGLGQYVSYNILNHGAVSLEITLISMAVIAIIVFVYVTKTLHPMQNRLFLDPISKKYGLKAHFESDKILKKE